MGEGEKDRGSEGESERDRGEGGGREGREGVLTGKADILV